LRIERQAVSISISSEAPTNELAEFDAVLIALQTTAPIAFAFASMRVLLPSGSPSQVVRSERG
jgi:hypothetical protein